MFLVEGAEFSRRIASVSLEGSVEVGQVVEPAFVAYFGDVPVGIDEQSGGGAEAYVYDVVGQCPARALTEVS